MERFRGGLVFKAHRLLFHSTLGSRVIEKRNKKFLHGFRIKARVSGTGMMVEGSGYRNVHWFRGGLEFKVRRLVHQSTLGLRVIKKKRSGAVFSGERVSISNLSGNEVYYTA